MNTTHQSYSDKLKNPKWQKKRLDILNRDKFTCQLCNSTEDTLHVHHKTYEKGVDPWGYEDCNLITYCMICHKLVELIKPIEVIKVAKRTSSDKSSMLVITSIISELGICVAFYDYNLSTEEFSLTEVFSEKTLNNAMKCLEAAKDVFDNKTKADG